MRSYDDEIHVRTAPSRDATSPAGGAPAPMAFLWRGRLHVVRTVVGHWYERRAWWARWEDRPAPARAVSGVSSVPLDREVWRVEASAGRTDGAGVYELCREGLDDWALRSVED